MVSGERVNYRPKLVWVIFIIGCGLPLGLLIEFLLLDTFKAMPGKVGQSYGSHETGYFVMGLLVTSFLSFAALQLFRLKEQAVILFALSVPLVMLDTWYQFYLWSEAGLGMSTAEAITSLTCSPALMALLAWYVHRLKEKGVLIP